MDDVISRQAAIDAIESAFDRETILNRFVRKIAISAVRKLPSAQPDLDEQDDFGTLAICAIRYCHGRQTCMPDLVRSIVRPHLKELSDKDLNVMIDDCDFQERMHLYGDERIDKPGWLKWKDELIAEKERRTDE